MKQLSVNFVLILSWLCLLGTCRKAQDIIPEGNWPSEVQTVSIISTADGTEQPAMFWAPEESAEPVPLVVALHTWSFGYDQPNIAYYAECRKRGWALIHPHFRGQNTKPEACGSPLVVQDIFDAVDWAKEQVLIDERRIYLAGGSGGGYASLLMAGKAPGIWAGVSSWCPITDLAAWHAESLRLGTEYHTHLEAVCGGAPGEAADVDAQYLERSAITHLKNAKGVAIEISTGIHDGHTGSVPVSHTLRAFNLLAELNGMPEKKLTDDEIRIFVESEEVPSALASGKIEDAAYSKPVLFRRDAGPVRVTIFDGGHDILIETAFHWLEKQRRPE